MAKGPFELRVTWESGRTDVLSGTARTIDEASEFCRYLLVTAHKTGGVPAVAIAAFDASGEVVAAYDFTNRLMKLSE